MHKNLSLILFGLLIFTPLVISTGCSNGLSRSNAADLISKHASFSKVEDITFFDNNSNKGFAQYPFYREMISLGYMDSDLKLTEKGKTSIAGLRAVGAEGMFIKYSMPPYLRREIIEVTGISEGNPVGASKEATFTWHWKPVNDIGKEMNKTMNLEKEKYTGSATFQKFDDGWRVKDIKLGI
jgi:hypothetical protein